MKLLCCTSFSCHPLYDYYQYRPFVQRYYKLGNCYIVPVLPVIPYYPEYYQYRPFVQRYYKLGKCYIVPVLPVIPYYPNYYQY